MLASACSICCTNCCCCCSVTVATRGPLPDWLLRTESEASSGAALTLFPALQDTHMVVTHEQFYNLFNALCIKALLIPRLRCTVCVYLCIYTHVGISAGASAARVCKPCWMFSRASMALGFNMADSSSGLCIYIFISENNNNKLLFPFKKKYCTVCYMVARTESV